MENDGFMGGADLNAPRVLVKRDIIFRGISISAEYIVRRMPDGSEFRVVGDGPGPIEIAKAEYKKLMA